jgi:Raf kinase inhibitor-like YbhB/YbcL family protein
MPPTAVATDTAPPPTATEVPELSISSPAFAPGEEIPAKYSCFGDNLSPPLAWTSVPEGTASLALVVDDPDSEPPGFVHWVLYNLPATAARLPEGVPAQDALEDGTLQGANGFGPFKGETLPGGAATNGVGYDGPCPPGRHRYVFTLYALDAPLDLPAGATASEVLSAMQGHIVAQALLAGAFTPP